MDEPAPASINHPSAVPRENLGRGESLVTTSKQIRKSSTLDREGWWRVTLTNTPIPGTYHIKTFIEESLLNPVKATYNFKNEGRKRIPLVQRNDPVPNDLPQYKPPDFLELLKKQMASYSFKDQPRPNPSTLVDKDEHEGPGPGEYNLKPPSAGSITSCFRSKVPRFLPASSKTPGPGAYTASRQFPKQSPTIAKMGREHNLFFNNTIGF
ncbi:protein STPG4 isoform X4 [Mesocricetus auratus]|uniref:Protein STPG4 isoform X4 n=1 Tax=Mesocricetus auratus TaxID=10036 RepID=A0ABM2X3U1_MESAU|nr:protein STPG4 isoform X4 [Mesocricetus auratus]